MRGQHLNVLLVLKLCIAAGTVVMLWPRARLGKSVRSSWSTPCPVFTLFLSANIAANDVAGNFSLTLVDVLDTLVILDDREGFEKAVKNVIQWVQFNVNTKPQVFETTIRVLGGLLSGHIFASRQGQPFYLPWYRGELLDLARDLGNRLLPAFSTRTGLPYARVLSITYSSLHVSSIYTYTKDKSSQRCSPRRNSRNMSVIDLLRAQQVQAQGWLSLGTAGAGSLILEFATLSRLTGDERFEKAAYKVFFQLLSLASDISYFEHRLSSHCGTANQILAFWAIQLTPGMGFVMRRKLSHNPLILVTGVDSA